MVTESTGNRSLLAALACAALSTPPALATPVQVIECGFIFSGLPLPVESVGGDFIIRRHIEHTEPFETTENEIWAQSKFAGNGYFEATVFPFEGTPRVARSTSEQTTLFDSSDLLGDEYLDEALTMEQTIQFEGFTLDSLTLILNRSDGSALDTHLQVPTELDWPDAWDPYLGCGLAGCPVECAMTWRAPGDGIPCGLGGSAGGTLCTTGTYVGKIISVTHEPHEHDHSGVGDFEINAGLNDAWVSADAALQGMFVTVFEDLGLVFVAWFTFDTGSPAQITTQSTKSAATFGAEDQRWVTAAGPFNGNRAELKAELTSGGSFNSAEPVPQQNPDYGDIVLEFDDCRKGKVTFDFPSAGQSGAFEIMRTLEDNVGLCEAMSNP